MASPAASQELPRRRVANGGKKKLLEGYKPRENLLGCSLILKGHTASRALTRGYTAWDLLIFLLTKTPKSPNPFPQSSSTSIFQLDQIIPFSKQRVGPQEAPRNTKMRLTHPGLGEFIVNVKDYRHTHQSL